MPELRADLPPLPERFKSLPLSERGYPVPWFVAWLDGDNEPLPRGEGRPEFRVMAPGAIGEAWTRQKCWLCGQRTGNYVAFTIGPMCGVNRNNAEPPSHRDCAIFAATACPFLVRPHARRRSLEDLFEDVAPMAGNPIMRNPGVAGVWVTKRGRVRPRNVENGILFHIGEPTEVLWFCEGRAATRDEVTKSVNDGLPELQKEAGRTAAPNVSLLHLERQLERFDRLLPAA